MCFTVCKIRYVLHQPFLPLLFRVNWIRTSWIFCCELTFNSFVFLVLICWCTFWIVLNFLFNTLCSFFIDFRLKYHVLTFQVFFLCNLLFRDPFLVSSQSITYTKEVWKVSDLAYNRRETWDKRLLGRDLDRSWCHLHTSLKHFWSKPMAPWTSATA